MNYSKIIQKSIDELEKVGIESAEVDVRALLKDVIDKGDVFILSHPQFLLTNAQYSKFRRLIRRRKKGEPIAYLVGHKEFYGYDFLVNKNVLIPRPETELLVENALHFLSSPRRRGSTNSQSISRFPIKSGMTTKNQAQRFNIIDIGTGSGCIIISLVKELLKKPIIHDSKFMIQYYATDISKKALTIAKRNTKLHNVGDRIKFFHSDLFSNKRLPGRYDLIIANLPYIPFSPVSSPRRRGSTNSQSISRFPIKSGMTDKYKDPKYEPCDAIFANDNGTQIIKRFLKQAKDRIDQNGMIVLELDPRNAKELQKYAKSIYTDLRIELIKDYAKYDRILKATTNCVCHLDRVW